MALESTKKNLPKPRLSKTRQVLPNLQAEDEPKKHFWQRDFAYGRVTLMQKALFAKHMSVMLRSGLNLVECLNITIDEATGKFRRVLENVRESLMGGNSLAASFEKNSKVFSKLFVNSTKIGEASGTLEENFKNIAEQMEKEQKLISKIKGAMLYPLVVLGTTFILGIALSFLVLPKITPLFEGLNVKLPWTTRTLIWFSHFITNYGYIFIGLLIIFFFFLVFILRQKAIQPVTHWLILHLPIVKSLAKNTNLIRFTRTLGMLLKSGLNIDDAIAITGETINNYYYNEALKNVSIGISSGTKLSTNLNKYNHLFPKLVSNMIAVGEESGRLDETLLYLADFYDFEVDNASKSLSTTLEPVLLMIIGAVVAFFALAIITPIYAITGSISPQ